MAAAAKIPPSPPRFPQAGRIAEREGAAGVTLHARTADQLYSPSADWGAIRELAAALRIPVIGNGDVFEGLDAVRMVRETGGRAGRRAGATRARRGGRSAVWMGERTMRWLGHRLRQAWQACPAQQAVQLPPPPGLGDRAYRGLRAQTLRSMQAAPA